MMCDFKPGDEVVCVRRWRRRQPGISLCHHIMGLCLVRPGRQFVVAEVSATDEPSPNDVVISLVGVPNLAGYWWNARLFRKVERRNDSLSIEAFLTIKPGFEEPKRAPAKKRERV